MVDIKKTDHNPMAHVYADNLLTAWSMRRAGVIAPVVGRNKYAHSRTVSLSATTGL